MMIPKTLVAIAILGLSCLFFTPGAQADMDIKPGVRAGGYFDPSDASIGAELLMNINNERTLFFNPNVEYVFQERASLWAINFDFHYDMLSAHEPVYFWLGGGPAILHRDPDNELLRSDTDFGVNVFAGLGFKIRGSSLVPYIQPKYTIADNSRFSLAFGLRF
ncbi:MAG TPA: hypothetical protein VLH08_01300 [Acidobacteriota bacterium]|nr:hypothetical protein [Acidobacteriota bacterium]